MQINWLSNLLGLPTSQSNLPKESPSVWDDIPSLEKVVASYEAQEIVLTDTTELSDALQLLLQMLRSEHSSNIGGDVRIHGKSSAYAMYYVLTDKIIDWKPGSRYELEAINNLLLIAPEWLATKIEPLVAQWRFTIYKDPDFSNMYSS